MAQIKKYDRGGELSLLQSLEDLVKEAYASADAETQQKMTALAGTYMNYAASRSLRDRDAIRLEIDKNQRLLQIALGQLGYDPLSSRVATFNPFGYLSQDEIGLVGNQLTRLTANGDDGTYTGASGSGYTDYSTAGMASSDGTITRSPMLKTVRYDLTEGLDDLIPKVGATNKDKMLSFINLVQSNIAKYMEADHTNEQTLGIGNLSTAQLLNLTTQLSGIKTTLENSGYSGTVFNNLVDILNNTGIASLKADASSYFSDILSATGTASAAAGAGASGNGIIQNSDQALSLNEDVLRSNNILELTNTDPYYDLVSYLDNQDLALRKYGSDYYLFLKGTTTVKPNYGRVIQLPWSTLRGQGIFTDANGKVTVGDISDGSELSTHFDINAARTASAYDPDKWAYFRYQLGQTVFKDPKINDAFADAAKILSEHGWGTLTSWLDLSDYIADSNYYVGLLKQDVTPEDADADVAGFNPNNFAGFLKINTDGSATWVSADDIAALWTNQGGTHSSNKEPIFSNIDYDLSLVAPSSGYSSVDLQKMWGSGNRDTGEIDNTIHGMHADLNIKDFFRHADDFAAFSKLNHGNLKSKQGYKYATDWYNSVFLDLDDAFQNFVKFIITYASHSLDVFGYIQFDGVENNPFSLAFKLYVSNVNKSDAEKQQYYQKIVKTYLDLVRAGKITRQTASININGQSVRIDTGDPRENAKIFINQFINKATAQSAGNSSAEEVLGAKQGGVLKFKVGGATVPSATTTNTQVSATRGWDNDGNYQFTDEEKLNLGITGVSDSLAEHDAYYDEFTLTGVHTAEDLFEDPVLRKRLEALSLDLAGTIAAFCPGYGTAVSVGTGLASTGFSLAADIADPTMSVTDILEEVGANVGLTLVGMIPGGGSIKAAKGFGKVVQLLKNTPRLAPYVVGVMSELGLGKDMLTRLSDPNHKWTKEDASDAMLFLSGILNFTTAAGNHRQNRLNRAATTNVTEVHTNKGVLNVDPKIAELVAAEGKLNGYDAANKLFKRLTGQNGHDNPANLDKTIYKNFGTAEEAAARQKLSALKKREAEKNLPEFETKTISAEHDPLKVRYEQQVGALNNSIGIFGLGFRPRTNYEIANGIGWGINTMTDRGALPWLALTDWGKPFRWMGETLSSLGDPRKNLTVDEESGLVTGKHEKVYETTDGHKIVASEYADNLYHTVKDKNGKRYLVLSDGKLKLISKSEFNTLKEKLDGAKRVKPSRVEDFEDPYNVKDRLLSVSGSKDNSYYIMLTDEGEYTFVEVLRDSHGRKTLVPSDEVEAFIAVNPQPEPEALHIHEEPILNEELLEPSVEPEFIEETRQENSTSAEEGVRNISDNSVKRASLVKYLATKRNAKKGLDTVMNKDQITHYMDVNDIKHGKVSKGGIVKDDGTIIYYKQGNKLTRLQNLLNNK